MSEPGAPTATRRPPPPPRLQSDTPQRRRRAIGIALAIAGASIALLLTLWPEPDQSRRIQLTSLWCLVCGDVGMQDVLQNVALLLPLGAGLGLAGWRWPRAVLFGLALALTVETLQYTVVPGRDASLSDVFTNTLGAGLGAFLAGRMDWLLRPPPRAAGRLAAGAVATWAVLWVAAGWLLGSSPGPVPWHATLQPELLDAPAFAGQVVRAELGGAMLHPGTQALPPTVREAYGRDTLSFRAEVVTAAPVTVRTGLLEVRDGDSTVQLTVKEAFGTVRFAMRTRSSLLRLRPIAFRAPAAPVEPAGTPLVLAVRRDGGAIVVPPRRAGEPELRAEIGPHWLAFLLLPFDARPGVAWELFAYLWVAALLLAAGWWVTQAPATSRLTLGFVAFAVVLGGLRSVAPVFHLSHPSALGWGVACGALAAGLLLGGLLAPDADS
jgi:hypothetical protein